MAAREIRVAAHHRATYWGRVQAGAFGICATLWIIFIMLQSGGRVSAGLGIHLFALQSWLAFFVAALAFASTSDSISREKREGTLGLLFLTHLKGFDVVFGKLVSALTLFASGLLAILPTLTISVLMGGVYFSQACHILVSLLNLMLFSAAAGLFGSSLSVKNHGGTSVALLILVFFCGGIPLCVALLVQAGCPPDISFALSMFSPLTTHQLASSALTGLSVTYFWISSAIVLAMSGAMLAVTCWITPRTWQQRVKEPALKRWTARYAAWSIRTIKSRSPLGRRLLDENAYEWLAARQLGASTRAWIFIAAVTLVAGALMANFDRHNEPAVVHLLVCIPLAYLLQINLKVRVGGHATDRFAEDRGCGALELLLTTGLSLRDMLKGEFRALRRHFLLPGVAVACLLAVAFGLCLSGVDHLAGLFYPDPTRSGFRWHAFGILLALIFFLPADAIALAWVGPASALAARKTHLARPHTMIRVMGSPIILWGVIFPALVQIASFRAWAKDDHFFAILGIACAYLAGSNAFWAMRARRWMRDRAWKHISDPPVISRDVPNPFAILARLRWRSKPVAKAAAPAAN